MEEPEEISDPRGDSLVDQISDKIHSGDDDSLSSGSESESKETQIPVFRGIDVNRAISMINCDEEAMVSSPNSTVSSLSGKRSERDENDGGDAAARKKLRLSKEQAAVLEETFKEQNTLNPKQKMALAKQLNLRPRQVEVWFQSAVGSAQKDPQTFSLFSEWYAVVFLLLFRYLNGFRSREAIYWGLGDFVGDERGEAEGVCYGEVLQTVVMRDKITGKPRGFGFVVFADPSIIDRILDETHVIDGRTVEAKRALSREEQQGSRGGNSGGARNFGGAGSTRTKKIFVGGLPPTVNEDGFRQYFETYGTVTDVVIMYDQQTNRPRGFGFVSFDSEDAVDRVLHKTFHDLYGKQVEVKRALPKDANPGGSGRSMGGGAGGGGGGYQGYGSSVGNSGSYDGRMEPNRFMQAQSAGGGYLSYGSSGYNAPGYGYGPANNGMGGYGYGSYGGGNPGYGGPAAGGYGNPNAANAGYGGPAGGGYGNPNAANTGYGGPPNAQRNSWGAQTPSGYGYGSSQWGAAGGGSGSGGVGAVSGQSPGGLTGYGNQGYGYGGNDGAYGNQSAYGAVGGRAGFSPSGGAPAGDPQAAPGGYGGGGYSDGSGNSGYGNSGWRSDPSQVSGNYGGGYGNASARQAQQ